jgi:hypothetical protein
MISRQIFLFVLTFSFAYNFADRCSKFEGFHGSLVECPQANFMVKDDLFECYDKHYKELSKYNYQFLLILTLIFLC